MQCQSIVATSRGETAPSSSGSRTRLGHQFAMELFRQCKASSGLPCSTLRLARTCTNNLASSFTDNTLKDLGQKGTSLDAFGFKLESQFSSFRQHASLCMGLQRLQARAAGAQTETCVCLMKRAAL